MNLFKRIIQYAPERRGYFYLTLVLAPIAGMVQTIAYYCLYLFFKSLIMPTGASLNAQTSYMLALSCLSFLVVGGLLTFTAALSSHYFAFRIETNLKKKGVSGLADASFSFFDTHDSGEVRRIIDDNTELTHSLIAHLSVDLLQALSSLIILLVLGALVNWVIFGLMLALFILSAALIFSMMGDMTKMKTYLTLLEKMNGEAVGFVRGIPVIKIFNVDVSQFTKFYDSIKEYCNFALQYSYSCKTGWSLFTTVIYTFPVIALFLGFVLLACGYDTPSVVLITLTGSLYCSVLLSQIMKVLFLSENVEQAKSCFDKLEDLYAKMRCDALEFGSTSELSTPSISFRNATFSYGDISVIKDFNCDFVAGKTYALVGHSGAGKSTIANLVSGFYKLDSGEILLGGRPLSDFSKVELNRHIATVFQNSKLFTMSLYDNVALGNPDASYLQVMDAFKRAGCMPIIERLPQKEKSIVGVDGVYLSGGEVQRIAIARALLKDADIIILDEASAATDPQCEYEILQAFRELIKNKTVLIIAHRLTTIRGVDEILVIDKGEVVERGSDKELMALGGLYKHLQDTYAKANDWSVIDD